jgi:Ca-activated chloride channel homolog
MTALNGTRSPKSLTYIPAQGPHAAGGHGTVLDGGLAPSFSGNASADSRNYLALPASTDELWVIARSISDSGPASAATDAEHPGTGAMIVELDDAPDKIIPLPLQHTDVKARVSAYIASVEVRQTFHNPFSGKIEAKYVFPLPQDAAVNEFVMTIGERRIRGIIREREEAEQIYADAKRQGRVASLLTQERPNIFTQAVANIEPGKTIDVTITYFNTLAYRDGWHEFVFPMVVGPRFNPPGFTNGVAALPRQQRAAGSLPADRQPTAVTYLKPTERSGHDIALSLEIDAGVAIEEFESKSHVIESKQVEPDKLRVRLGELDRIPNKDFVLRYRAAGDRLKSNLLTHRDERGGFFTLMVYPPADLKQLRQHPLELVFVLDCSGSMNGEPIAQAKAAIRRALQQMRPEDSFQLIRFSNDASQLGKRPLAATPANVARGLAYLDSLNGDGGTMMIEGIKAALDFPQDPGRLRFVVFLTDGFIGNEVQIFSEVHRRLGDARIFSFGVGSSPNGYLLDGLARIGKGAVAYLGLQDDAARVMDDFMTRVKYPALMDVRIDWGALEVKDVYPTHLPDLFVGRPLLVTGRFDGDAASSVKLIGKAGVEPVEIKLDVSPADTSVQHPGIASVWARKKIMELSDHQAVAEDPTLPTQIKQVALDFSLMSAYTAFVAVDSLSQTGSDPATTVPQPVPVPEGVKYETTAGSGNADR